MRCHVCGCRDIGIHELCLAVCPGGCWWVYADLCSSCHGLMQAGLNMTDIRKLRRRVDLFQDDDCDKTSIESAQKILHGEAVPF